MINLDKYMDRTVDFTINGEVVKVQEASNKLFNKMIAYEELENGNKSLETQLSLVTEMLNRNTSGRKFIEEEVSNLPQAALNKIYREVIALTHKPLNDPN